MNQTQIFRNNMANFGYELTPHEAKQIMVNIENFIKHIQQLEQGEINELRSTSVDKRKELCKILQVTPQELETILYIADKILFQ